MGAVISHFTGQPVPPVGQLLADRLQDADAVADQHGPRPLRPCFEKQRSRSLTCLPVGDRCLWHAGGTAGGNDDACTWR